MKKYNHCSKILYIYEAAIQCIESSYCCISKLRPLFLMPKKLQRLNLVKFDQLDAKIDKKFAMLVYKDEDTTSHKRQNRAMNKGLQAKKVINLNENINLYLTHSLSTQLSHFLLIDNCYECTFFMFSVKTLVPRLINKQAKCIFLNPIHILHTSFPCEKWLTLLMYGFNRKDS